jgi:hypothetical protein
MLDSSFGLDLRQSDVVWVCENPSIVSLAADQLGDACRPLLCLEGMPSTVTSRILDVIRQAGCRLRVHSGFDFGGIAITAHMRSRS